MLGEIGWPFFYFTHVPKFLIFFFDDLPTVQIPVKITNICPLIMTAKNFYRIIFLLLAGLHVLLLPSCGGDKEAIVQEKVAERVTAFKAKKSAECLESLLETAERKVDSLLLAEAQNALNDSLSRLRPWRPFQPAPIQPIDSLTVKPIFDGNMPDSERGGG